MGVRIGVMGARIGVMGARIGVMGARIWVMGARIGVMDPCRGAGCPICHQPHKSTRPFLQHLAFPPRLSSSPLLLASPPPTHPMHVLTTLCTCPRTLYARAHKVAHKVAGAGFRQNDIPPDHSRPGGV